EVIDQVQSLIEKFLRLRIACRNRMMNVSHPRHQRRRLGLRRMSGMVLRRRSQAQTQGEQKRNAESHGTPPPLIRGTGMRCNVCCPKCRQTNVKKVDCPKEKFAKEKKKTKKHSVSVEGQTHPFSVIPSETEGHLFTLCHPERSEAPAERSRGTLRFP